MGPLTLADFIGLDVCLAILEVLHDGLGEPKYRPCPLLRRWWRRDTWAGNRQGVLRLLGPGFGTRDSGFGCRAVTLPAASANCRRRAHQASEATGPRMATSRAMETAFLRMNSSGFQ